MGGTPFSVVAPQNYYECATFQMTTRTGQGNRRWGGWGHIQRNCCAGASTRAWFSTLNSLDSKGSSLASSSTSGLWKVTSEERTGLIKNSRGNNKNWNVEDLKRESYTNRQKWIQNLINSRHQFTENLFTGIQFLPRVRTPRYTVVGFQFLSPLRVLWSRISSYQTATRNCIFLWRPNGISFWGILNWWSTSRLFKFVPPL